jgi:serine/threonine-protein kinase
VAVKVLKPELSVDRSLRVRFHKEAQALAPIRHPNVVRFIELVVGEPTLLVTEYAPGPTLREAIEKEGRLQPARASAIAVRLSWALHAVHAAGVIHRDMKPANVVLTPNPDGGETPKLIDFGLAKLGVAQHLRITRTGTILGTPQYMAPEQVAGRDVDARADVYALGCVLYEMLVGHPPFPDCVSDAEVLEAQVMRSFTPVQRIAPDVPDALAAVLEKMTAKLAIDRYPTMIEASHALSTWSTAPPESPDGLLGKLKKALRR